MRTGAFHLNRFRNFVLRVGLCPPLLELLLKMALFFQPSHRFLGETVESDLCGVASGMGQGCAPRLAFGLHSARGWGPGPQVIKFRFRTTATSVSLCVKRLRASDGTGLVTTCAPPWAVQMCMGAYDPRWVSTPTKFFFRRILSSGRVLAFPWVT